MSYEDGLEREMGRVEARRQETLRCRTGQQMQARAHLSEALQTLRSLEANATAARIRWLAVSRRARREFCWRVKMAIAGVRNAYEALADSWEEFDD